MTVASASDPATDPASGLSKAQTVPDPTLSQLLIRAVPVLRAAGVADPAGDARRLLADAADLPADRLTLHLPDPATPSLVAQFQAHLMRRAARQPVAQILGRRQFWGHSFRVTPDVLDPRPETEVLVAEALAEPVSRLLDLGTGSGAILLSVLSSSPASTGIGTDLSQAALAVARGNARALGLAARAAFRHGNWFKAVAPGCSFDLILSNPPYITQAELAALDPEVRLWEPALALSPGGDGLDAYRAIAAGALARLTPGGRLAVEIGPTQARAVGDLMAAAGLRDPRVVSDLDGRPRVVLARRPR